MSGYTEKDWITKRIWDMRKGKGFASLQFIALVWFIPITFCFDIYYDLKNKWRGGEQ